MDAPWSVLKKDGEWLPLYHCTHNELLDNIMEDGLDPTKMNEAWKESEWEASQESGYEHSLEEQPSFVFLSHNLRFPRGWKKMKEEKGFPCTILVVRPPLEILKELVLDIGEFIRCPVLIPPQFIEVYKE